MYLWVNSCAKYIIAIDDVLLREFFGFSVGTFDGVGAAAGSNLGMVRSCEVARCEVQASDTILAKSTQSDANCKHQPAMA